MEKSKKSSGKNKSYLDLEVEKKKTGRMEDLPKSPNKGVAK